MTTSGVAATNSGSLETADRLVDFITDRFYLQAGHPNIGRIRDEDLRPEVEKLSGREYVIIYPTQDEDALVLRVVSASPDIAALYT